MFDYHVHSTFSVDCAIPMESSCRAAIAAGVTEIAFTDHVDHVPADPGYGYYRADEYLREVDRVRDQFSGELTVLRGAEIDFNEGTTEHVERFVAEYGNEFDFVIGSVHYAADGAMIFPDYFAPRTMDDVFLPYLATSTESRRDRVVRRDRAPRPAEAVCAENASRLRSCSLPGAPGADLRRDDRARRRL